MSFLILVEVIERVWIVLNVLLHVTCSDFSDDSVFGLLHVSEFSQLACLCFAFSVFRAFSEVVRRFLKVSVGF